MKKPLNITDLLEMKDWKQHFTNGTKGLPKTNPGILNYVEGFLKKIYDGNEEKVNNNPLAPWLVKTISEIGPANINTEKINRLKSVAEYVKKTGNVANIPKMDLVQASEFAKEKLDKFAQKEKFAAQGEKPQEANPEQEKIPEPEKELSPKEKALQYQEQSKSLFAELKDEKEGKIERVWTCTDGSGRMWVKVLDNKWLGKSCETGESWGIECQDVSFNKGYINYQLIGPPKNNPGPIVTIVGMGILISKKSIAEVKQENNVQPGSQTTSGGWNDADVQLIEFLSYSPEAKWIEYFGDYSGNIQLNPNNSLHGGGIGFLYHISKKRPDLFKFLANHRPDMIEANKEIIQKFFGNIDELINFNITEFAQKNPDAFLLKLKDYIQRYGQEAKDILNKLDLEDIAKNKPELIESALETITGVIPAQRLFSIINFLNLSNFIHNNKLEAYDWFKKLSNFGEYKKFLKDIILKYKDIIVPESDDANKNIVLFLGEMSKPKSEKQANAKYDPIKKVYIGTRYKRVKDEHGNDVLDNGGNPVTEPVEYQVPDDALILQQKDRRDFVVLNKEKIKASVKSTDERGKEISYLRILFSQMNFQDVERQLKAEKDLFVNYYNEKFLKKEKKKVNVPGEGVVQENYMPGEFELFNITNPSDIVNSTLGVRIYPIGIEKAKEIHKNILAYYFSIFEKEPKITRTLAIYQSISCFIETLIESGESEDSAVQLFVSTFNPVSIAPTDKIAGYGYMFQMVKRLMSHGGYFDFLQKNKEKLLSLGLTGRNIYENGMKDFSAKQYFVQSGDFILYKNNFYPEEFNYYAHKSNLKLSVLNDGPIYLTPGRKYKVLDVGKYSNAINGKVLILDEGYILENGKKEKENISPQERWFSTTLFDVKSRDVIQKAGLEEQNVRNFIQDRIQMIVESKLKKSISYTGIVLDSKSQDKLYNWIKEMIKAKKLPSFDGWNFAADHITINTGSAQNQELLYKKVEVKVIQYAFDDKIAAISIVPTIDGVEIEFTKEKPHITLAFDESNGARPVMSNSLTNWRPVPKSFILTGEIKEVEH